MEKIRTGPVPMLLVGAVSCLAVACASSAPRVTSSASRETSAAPRATSHAAAAGRKEFPAHLFARSISVASPEDVGPIEIYVERWSTDDEFDKLLAGFEENGPGEM